MEEIKKPWLSKTLWINAIVAVLALAYPAGNAWFVANPEIVLAIFAMLNMVLRLVTKEKLSFWE